MPLRGEGTKSKRKSASVRITHAGECVYVCEACVCVLHACGGQLHKSHERVLGAIRTLVKERIHTQRLIKFESESRNSFC